MSSNERESNTSTWYGALPVRQGFSGLTDVMLERRDQDGHFLVDGQQQSFFLAETLK